MIQRFLQGVVATTLFVGICLNAAYGQVYPWHQVSVNPAPPHVSPYPPEQCHPLIPAPLLPVARCEVAQVPPGCMPVITALPLRRPEPSVQIGYLYNDDGVQINVDFGGTDERILSATRTNINLRGIWAECTLPITLTHRQDFILSIGHLFPFRTRAHQLYHLIDVPAAEREWNPDMRWWEVNTAWTCRLGSIWSAIVGFRWAQLVVEFDQARNQQGFSSSGDVAKLNANAYIPFMGLVFENRSPRVGLLRAAVIGSPFLPGDFEHSESLSLTGRQVWTKFAPSGEYKSGYFFEATGEYAVRSGDWSVGAFARFTAMHVERDRRLHVNGILNQAEIAIDRRNWIFGGTVGFSL